MRSGTCGWPSGGPPEHAAVVALLVALGPEPEAQEFEPALTEVQVQSVRLDTQRVTVTVDGTGAAWRGAPMGALQFSRHTLAPRRRA